MEARFLAGLDTQFVDYADIDADTQLDDHWLEEEGRDAEDAYFDDDSMGGDMVMEAEDRTVADESQEGKASIAELEEWERMAEECIHQSCDSRA